MGHILELKNEMFHKKKGRTDGTRAGIMQAISKCHSVGYTRSYSMGSGKRPRLGVLINKHRHNKKFQELITELKDSSTQFRDETQFDEWIRDKGVLVDVKDIGKMFGKTEIIENTNDHTTIVSLLETQVLYIEKPDLDIVLGQIDRMLRNEKMKYLEKFFSHSFASY